MKKKTILLIIFLLVLLAAAAGTFLLWRNWQPQQQAQASTSETAAATTSTESSEPAETVPEETAPAETEAPQEETEPTEPFVGTGFVPPERVQLPPEGEFQISDRWGALSWHHVTAQEYFVYDMDRDLFRMRTCEEEDLLYPASITKLFTAYTALQCVPADTQITAGTEIRMIAPLSSVADLQVGDTLTVDQLIGGMLLPSGNDAAYVLAAGIGRILADNPELSNREAVDRFVARMNEEAQKVGMTASHFVTPDGIHDDNHYISVRDFIILGRIAVENELIAKHASTSKLTVKTAEGRTITWLSSNLMLQIEEWYRCKYAFGLKTGYTTSAGFCLLSYMKVGDRNLLIGVFDCERANARFEDTLLLLVQSFGLAP